MTSNQPPNLWQIELANARIERTRLNANTRNPAQRRKRMLEAWLYLFDIQTTEEVHLELRLSVTPPPQNTSETIAVLWDLEKAGLVEDMGTTWKPKPEAMHLKRLHGVYSRLWRRTQA